MLCVGLQVRQNIWGWPIGMVNVGLYVYIFFEAKLYADMGLNALYFVLCAVGWWHWLYPGENRPRLPVTRLTRRDGWRLFAIGLVGWVAMAGYFSIYTDAALPVVDSLTVAMSLVAQWLLTRKVLENWHLWIAADVIMVGIYWVKGLQPTVVLYTIYTFLALSGLLAWRKELLTAIPTADDPPADDPRPALV